MSIESRLPRSTPEAQAVSSTALLGFVDALDRSDQELHSVMVLRRGHVVTEGWWSPYRASERHLLFSLSKSFASVAVGLVVADGKLSLDDRVVSFFPGDLPEKVGDNLAAMTVRHLLTMTAGHTEGTVTGFDRRPDAHWLRSFLALEVTAEPGSSFVYSSGATYALSAIVQQVTGEPLLDYLRPRFLEPLGMTEATWERSPQGVDAGGWGLSLTTESVAVFGQVMLQNGRWQDAQLVPAEWLSEATAPLVSTAVREEADWKQGYGYQFWTSRHGYRADGAFGQFCVVLPEQDTVVVTTAAGSDLQMFLTLVWDHLLPALDDAAPRPEDPAAHRELTDRLAALALVDPPQGDPLPAPALRGTSYAVYPNPLGLDGVRFGDDMVTLVIGADEIVCGPAAWHEGTVSIPGLGSRVIAGGVRDGDAYVATVRFPETPYRHTLTMRADGDRLTIDASVNVVLSGPTTHTLTARRHEGLGS